MWGEGEGVKKKFEAGERVRVYRCPAPFDGVIDSITTGTNNETHIGVIEDGFYSQHGDGPFHPKQCRRLIKKPRPMVVCAICAKLIEDEYRELRIEREK